MVTRTEAVAGLRAAAETIKQLSSENSILLEKVATLEQTGVADISKTASDTFDSGVGFTDNLQDSTFALSIGEKLEYLERGEMPPNYLD